MLASFTWPKALKFLDLWFVSRAAPDLIAVTQMRKGGTSDAHQNRSRSERAYYYLCLIRLKPSLSIIFRDGQLVRHHRKGLRDRRRRHDCLTVNRKNAVQRGQNQSPRHSPPHGLFRRTRQAVQRNLLVSRVSAHSEYPVWIVWVRTINRETQAIPSNSPNTSNVTSVSRKSAILTPFRPPLPPLGFAASSQTLCVPDHLMPLTCSWRGTISPLTSRSSTGSIIWARWLPCRSPLTDTGVISP